MGNTLAALCTDEDIALWDALDFVNLAPRSQVIAAGSDGEITGGAWVISSDSVDFLTQGCEAGNVVILTRPTTAFTTSGGDVFAVDSATALVNNTSTVTIRRLGQDANAGQPPVVNNTNSVSFTVRTFGPQIAISSDDIRRAYRLGYSGRQIGDLEEDGEELRQACVLHVLRRAYLMAQKRDDGDYKLKLDLINETLADLTARLQLRWGAEGTAQPPTTRFSTRLYRG
jgi:hypothetical protein